MKMNFFDEELLERESTLEKLRESLVNFSDETSEVILLGGSALILRYRTEVETFAIDAVREISNLLISKCDLQVVNEAMVFLPKGYRERLILVGKIGNINISALSSLDKVLMKIGRSSQKDTDDAQYMIKSGQVSLEDFKEAYACFRSDYVGDRATIDNTCLTVTGEGFRKEMQHLTKKLITDEELLDLFRQYCDQCMRGLYDVGLPTDKDSFEALLVANSLAGNERDFYPLYFLWLIDGELLSWYEEHLHYVVSGKNFLNNMSSLPYYNSHIVMQLIKLVDNQVSAVPQQSLESIEFPNLGNRVYHMLVGCQKFIWTFASHLDLHLEKQKKG